MVPVKSLTIQTEINLDVKVQFERNAGICLLGRGLNDRQKIMKIIAVKWVIGGDCPCQYGSYVGIWQWIFFFSDL